MARETKNDSGAISERAARRQRREQAAAAMEVTECNWTSAVDVIATPKRAAVVTTPGADAGGARATDAGVPAIANMELTPPHNREQAIANAELIPPQTHREPAIADADVIPPQQPPHGGAAAHGLYDDIPLPSGMPRWVTADERPVAWAADAAQGHEDGGARSLPITLFQSFHHDHNMAKVYEHAAPIVGSSLSRAAGMRGTVRIEDNMTDGGEAAWAAAWPGEPFDPDCVVKVTPLEFAGICGAVSDRVDANWQLMVNVWPDAARAAHRAVPGKAARIAAIFGLSADALRQVAWFAENHELPAPTLHADAGIDGSWFDTAGYSWVRQSILHQHMLPTCRNVRGLILVSGLGEGKGQVPLFLTTVTVQDTVDLVSGDPQLAEGCASAATTGLTEERVSRISEEPTVAQLIMKIEGLERQLSIQKSEAEDKLRRAVEAGDSALGVTKKLQDQLRESRDRVANLEADRKSDAAKIKTLNEKGAAAVRQRDELQVQLDKMAAAYYVAKAKYKALAGDELSASSGDGAGKPEQVQPATQDPFSTAHKPRKRKRKGSSDPFVAAAMEERPPEKVDWSGLANIKPGAVGVALRITAPRQASMDAVLVNFTAAANAELRTMGTTTTLTARKMHSSKKGVSVHVRNNTADNANFWHIACITKKELGRKIFNAIEASLQKDGCTLNSAENFNADSRPALAGADSAKPADRARRLNDWLASTDEPGAAAKGFTWD